MKKLIASLLSLSLLSSCAAPPAGGPSPDHGFTTAANGLGQLILSPFMIIAGLLEGIASLP